MSGTSVLRDILTAWRLMVTQGVLLWLNWLMSVTSLYKLKRQCIAFWLTIVVSCNVQQLMSSSSTLKLLSSRLTSMIPSGCAASCLHAPWRQSGFRRAAWLHLRSPTGSGSQILAFTTKIFPAVARKWSRTFSVRPVQKGMVLATAALSERRSRMWNNCLC